MSKEFIAAIKQICSEKNIEEEAVINAVEQALATAYRKDYWNKDQEIEVKLHWDSIESATVYIIKEVVNDVEDENYEISLKEAKKINPSVKYWDEIKMDVTPIWYGRIAAQSAKQVIHQKIQEAERQSIFEKFKNREWSILYWVINRVEWTNVTIDIEKNIVNIPYRHQIKWEEYYTWKRICVLLESVQKTAKWPNIIISRSSIKLVEKLLEKEIPEINDWDVQIMSIARDPWNRSKIAVKSNDTNIDPIWACVWSKWSRINIITEELGWERIDMLEWDENPAKLISKSLQPAKIAKVIIINETESEDSTWRRIKKRAAVFVEEDQRAMAIWKKWQNIRLATDLTWFELDMYNIEELPAFEKRLEELKHNAISYTLEEEDEEEEKPRNKWRSK